MSTYNKLDNPNSYRFSGLKGNNTFNYHKSEYYSYFSNRGLDIAHASTEQIREGVQTGFFQNQRLSELDISNLNNVLTERMTYSAGTQSGYGKQGAVQNAQQWFSGRNPGTATNPAIYQETPNKFDSIFSGLNKKREFRKTGLSAEDIKDAKVDFYKANNEVVGINGRWKTVKSGGQNSSNAMNFSAQSKSVSLGSGATTDKVAFFNKSAKSTTINPSVNSIGTVVPGVISDKAAVITSSSQLLSDKVAIVNENGVRIAGKKFIASNSKYLSLSKTSKGAVQSAIAQKYINEKSQINYFKNYQLKKGFRLFGLKGLKFSKAMAIPAIALGGGFAIGSATVIPMMSTALLSPISATTNSEIDVSMTPLQQGIDYTDEYLQAYEENIFNYNEGSERAEKGIPKPWVLTDELTTIEKEQMVQKSPTAYRNEAEFVNEEGISGYDLRQYWGPKSFEYKGSVTCRCANCSENGETDENGEPKGKTYQVILKGTAGLRGNASSDGTLYGHNADGEWDGDTYRGYISENSETYDNRTSEDTEYRFTHKYHGSPYSEYETRDEYEPLEKLQTALSYKQGTAKEDPTEGIGNAANSVVDNKKMGTGKYYPTQNIQYSKTQMFHAFGVMAIGIVHNADECRKIFKKYMKKTYDLECNYAILTLNTYPVSEYTNTLTERDILEGHYSKKLEEDKDKVAYNIKLPCGSVVNDCKILNSFKAVGFLNVEYKYCSIQDLIRLEEEDVDWIDKTTNEWLHDEVNHETEEEMAVYNQTKLKKSDVYSITDEDNERYKVWNDINKDGKWIGWFTEKTHGRRSAYLDYSMNHYQLSDEDWAYAYPDITWPVGYTDNDEVTRLVQFKPTSKKVFDKDALDLGDIDLSNIDLEQFMVQLEGGVKLDMFKYLNQADPSIAAIIRGASGETIKKSGCLDLSVLMIAEYYLRKDIPVNMVSQYANSKGGLDAASALAQFGLSQGSNTYGNFKAGVASELDQGRPTILHIRGYWESSSGEVLHLSENGHFLVATGYDNDGLYVYDPGRRANTYITFADWSTVNDLYYRPVYAN